ncbi:hypothetical protein E8E13_001943 [Curvularia kusanoi]|uniref:CID domain-containing protein n=1 Tax=Curvularia kusanoi TaxID=90978 RepID=A0A9P4WEM8_CURKU|nr:hypothetical protein E8E13_001943 [Curvularia kusanoi]
MAQTDSAKRATTAITIAQLKFKQGLKKEEPEARLPPVPVETCSQLFGAIDAVLAQNTPVNIQKCTEWIVKHIAPSKSRVAVFGDYLVSVSKSLVVDSSSVAAKKVSRNRLDLLLVVNDALHTDKYHHNSTAKSGLLGTGFTSHLAELVELAASCAAEKDSKAEKKLKAIINYWALNQLVSDEALKVLREQADESLLQAQGGAPVRKRHYLLPEYHGDRTAPWYELPASYMLDQMIRQPNRPLEGHRIRAARFDKKPASAHVRKLLDNYFENIDLKHTPTGDNPTGETTKYSISLDPLGQLVKRDKDTNETVTVANGYGWSMKFCQDMQKDGVPESIRTLREDAERMEAAPQRERDQRRYSRSPRRRRRSSSVSSRGRDRNHRSRSGSYTSQSSYDSRSRSRSRHHDHRGPPTRTEERGRNDRDRRFDACDNDGRRPPPRPIERGPQQPGGQWHGQQTPSRNSQGSPGSDQNMSGGPQNLVPNFSQAAQPPFNAPPPFPPMSNQFPGSFPMQPFPPPPPIPFQTPGGFPGGIPPPPPPNYSGPFPPPPPNIAAMPNNPYNVNNQWNDFARGNMPSFGQQNQGGFQNQFKQNQPNGQSGYHGGRGGYGGNQGEWEAVRILAQTGQGFGLKYLIEWEGVNPITGQRWEPTWEKAEYASEGLRKLWKREQAQQVQEGESVVAATQKDTQNQRGAEASRAQAARTRGARRRPIVESSDDSSSASESELSTEAASSAGISLRSTATYPDADLVSPRVNTNVRSDSFERSGYSLPSEVPESPEESSSEATDLHSSDLFVSQPAFRASGVVQETPSSAGDLSYITVTQEELESSLNSFTDDESEDHVVGYSGLLCPDAAPTLGARAHSPATSVAETVADTIQDLHSLRQSESQPEQAKIANAAETPALFTETILSSLHSKSPCDCRSDSNTAGLAADSLTPFVENTTELDYEDLERFQQSQLLRENSTEQRASLEEEVEITDPDTQIFVNSTESELLAVAETPQVSQLSHSAQGFVSSGSQRSRECQSEPLQLSLEYEPEVSLIEVSVLEENAQLPFFSQHPTAFDLRSISDFRRRALTEPPQSFTAHKTGIPHFSESLSSKIDQDGSALHDSEESTTIDEISQPGKSILDTNLDGESSVADSQPLQVSDQSTGSGQHETQFVPSSAVEDSQQEITQAALVDSQGSKHPSPCSRHDSSQETPERDFRSLEHISSPIPHPPNHSLRTCDSNIPSRPLTPTLTSSSSKMAGSPPESTSEWAARRLQEEQEAAYAELLARPKHSNISAEGTRSPSTVPDRPPAPPAQTSLRSVAFANAKDKATETLLGNPLAATSTNTDAGPSKEKASLVAAVAAAAAEVPNAPESSPKESADDGIDDMSDVDQDSDLADYQHDDLDLGPGEYIVPLYIEGRQRDSYGKLLDRKTDVLEKALEDLKDTKLSPKMIGELDRIFRHAKDIETHPDLSYAEAESATGLDLRPADDIQHGAQFGIDNSVKFKFLGELFNQLREHELHIVLLLDHENVALSNILNTFLTAGNYNYSIYTPKHDSKASNDALKVTVFPSTTSPVIRPVDLIVCLDVVQNAAQIRQNNWAGKGAPVLHLVIPRSVGHIERYFRGNTANERTEVTLIGLCQFMESNEIGNRIDIDTPDAVQSARLVATWLTPEDTEESSEWPLPSIGTLDDYLEAHGTQQSVRSTVSSPAPERTKRPLDDDDYDMAKRMRFTPQPRTAPTSSVVHGPELTRISDSMPDATANVNARLDFEKIEKEHLRVLKEYQQDQIMWNEQQTQHENREQQNRKLLNDKAELERSLESMTNFRDKYRAQLDAKADEVRELRENLDAQRNIGLASTDEKDAEITRLRKELEAATVERTKALNSVKSTESQFDWAKEQYRVASNTATQLKSDLDSLRSENEKLAQQASGEVAKIKKLHLDRSMKNMMQQNKVLQNELSQLKTILKQREEELVRAKNNSGRAAYGTRGQSTTPQPKTRSRAASPARAPRGGGRISNLVAEER